MGHFFLNLIAVVGCIQIYIAIARSLHTTDARLRRRYMAFLVAAVWYIISVPIVLILSISKIPDAVAGTYVLGMAAVLIGYHCWVMYGDLRTAWGPRPLRQVARRLRNLNGAALLKLFH